MHQQLLIEAIKVLGQVVHANNLHPDGSFAHNGIAAIEVANAKIIELIAHINPTIDEPAN